MKALASPSPSAVLTADDLRALARPDAAHCSCSTVRCPGWDSFSAALAEPGFVCIGSLRVPGDEEPTLTEWHPQGSSYWSPEAPLAVAWFPYNRCSVWQCRACGRGFVQYTEFGGYYVDHRVREINPALVV